MAELVLVNPPDKSGGEGHPPLGLGYIASYLRKYLNFDSIAIVDKEKDILMAIKQHNPEIVGISAVTPKMGSAMEIGNLVKTKLDLPVILGGVHITCLPHTLPKYFDVGVLGEGEETILELMTIYEKLGGFPIDKLKEVKGIAYHNNENVVINERRELTKNLDSIPFPARDLFKMEEHYLQPRRSYSYKSFGRGTHILTSRGCPFKCVFCSSSQYWKIIRYHSPAYVVEEMKELVEKYKVETICIFDDLFAADVKRLEEIVRLMKKEKLNEMLSFRCYTRVNFMINEKICKLMKEMGIKDVTLGFESGSQKILSYLKKDTTTVEQNREAAQVARKHSFNVQGCFMIGSPNETKDDMIMTLKFIRENPVDSIDLCVTCAFPGTELWEWAKQKRLVNDYMDWNKVDLRVTPDLKDNVFLNDKMTKEEFMTIYNSFKKEVDKRNYATRIKLSDIFSANLIKRGISHPREALKFFYYTVLKNFVK